MQWRAWASLWDWQKLYHLFSLHLSLHNTGCVMFSTHSELLSQAISTKDKLSNAVTVSWLIILGCQSSPNLSGHVPRLTLLSRKLLRSFSDFSGVWLDCILMKVLAPRHVEACDYKKHDWTWSCGIICIFSINKRRGKDSGKQVCKPFPQIFDEGGNEVWNHKIKQHPWDLHSLQ